MASVRRRVGVVLWAAVGSLLAGMMVGCGGANANSAGAAELDVARLYPMGTGFVWSYDVDTGTGVSTLAITRVVAASGSRFEVASGSDPIVYERRPEGIYRVSSDAWLLRAPLRVGAEWPSAMGTARVTSTDAHAETVAGTFRGCVEVSETGDHRTARTIYCPDVGPVYVESTMHTELADRTIRVVGQLRGYQLGE